MIDKIHHIYEDSSEDLKNVFAVRSAVKYTILVQHALLQCVLVYLCTCVPVQCILVFLCTFAALLDGFVSGHARPAQHIELYFRIDLLLSRLRNDPT